MQQLLFFNSVTVRNEAGPLLGCFPRKIISIYNFVSFEICFKIEITHQNKQNSRQTEITITNVNQETGY